MGILALRQIGASISFTLSHGENTGSSPVGVTTAQDVISAQGDGGAPTGDPEDEFRWNVDVTFDRITVGYEMRYIGPQYAGGVLFENLNPLNGLPPQNVDQIDITSYPGITYHDLRFDYRIGGGGEAGAS